MEKNMEHEMETTFWGEGFRDLTPKKVETNGK